MSMSNSQEVLTSSSGTKKKPRSDSYFTAVVRRNDDQLSRPHHPRYRCPTVNPEIHIDPAMMGIIFSAFARTYAPAQIPGGMFLDRFGNKLTYAMSIFFWSLFTLLQSFTLGLKSLLLLRWTRRQ